VLFVTNLPIACTLTADALRERRQGLPTELLRFAEHREETSEGVRVRFAPSSNTLTLLMRAVDAERQCCRFLRFSITVEPDEGPLFVELTGPPGTREFLAELLQ
jgi:hypothetical protein